MNLKSKIFIRLTSLFRITEPQSWCRISAADVLAVPDCGKVALNKLRLYLAHRGLSLRGDNPPAYWLETLGQVQPDGLHADGFPPYGVCPFTIVIDTNETFPFTFDQIGDRDWNLVKVPTVRRPLYTSGLADYTIDGMETLIQLERKAEDLASSMSERRDIFEQEIRRLSEMCEYAAVIVESPWSEILADDHTHGARAKSISRTVIASFQVCNFSQKSAPLALRIRAVWVSANAVRGCHLTPPQTEPHNPLIERASPARSVHTKTSSAR